MSCNICVPFLHLINSLKNQIIIKSKNFYFQTITLFHSNYLLDIFYIIIICKVRNKVNPLLLLKKVKLVNIVVDLIHFVFFFLSFFMVLCI